MKKRSSLLLIAPSLVFGIGTLAVAIFFNQPLKVQILLYALGITMIFLGILFALKRFKVYTKRILKRVTHYFKE